MKSVLISIRPRWCAEIFNGRKNIEFRKTIPKIEMPFKCYVYCTAAEQKLVDIIRPGEKLHPDAPPLPAEGGPIFIKVNNSPATVYGMERRIIGEFTVDRIEEVTLDFSLVDHPVGLYGGHPDKTIRSGGMTLKEFLKYKGKGHVYGWHISDYKLYPYKEQKTLEAFGIKHPPQSWRYTGD